MYFLSKYRKKIYSVRDTRRLFATSSNHDTKSGILPTINARSLSSNVAISDKTALSSMPASAIFESFLNKPKQEFYGPISHSQSSPVTLASPQPSLNYHINLVEMMKLIPAKVNNMHSKVNFDEETISAANTQGGLFVNQLVLEEKQLTDAMKSYEQMTNNLIKMGRGTGMKRIQKTMLQWFENFRDEIAKESRLVETQTPGTDRSVSSLFMLILHWIESVVTDFM